jgi:ataxin-3
MLEKDMDKIEALIFNSSSHWFAIRKIEGIWFNLNSTNSLPGPEIISDFYLSAFIQGAEDIGYTNFLVTKLPFLPDLKSGYTNLQPYQKLASIEDITKAKNIKKIKDHQRLDKDKQDKKDKTDKKDDNEETEEDKNKFKAFTGKGTTLDSSIKITNTNTDIEMDDEFKQAYELSIEEGLKSLEMELPAEPESDGDNVYNIIFKIGDETFTRKFYDNNTINVKI